MLGRERFGELSWKGVKLGGGIKPTKVSKLSSGSKQTQVLKRDKSFPEKGSVAGGLMLGMTRMVLYSYGEVTDRALNDHSRLMSNSVLHPPASRKGK